MSTRSADPTAFHPVKITADRETEIGFELEPITKKITLAEVPENIIRLQTDRKECKITAVV